MLNRSEIFNSISNIGINIKKEYLHLGDMNKELITEIYDLDSLQFMNFICEVEQTFNITFRDDITYEELNNKTSLVIEMEFMPYPLVLTGLSVGQRNYFDCYESLFGGLLAAQIKNYKLIQKLYSQLDCLAIYTDERDNVFLQPKAIEINLLIIK